VQYNTYIYIYALSLMKSDSPMLRPSHIYNTMQWGSKWCCDCVYILFSNRYVKVYTTNISLIDRQEFLPLNARLWSTRPKNLIDRLDGSAVQDREGGRVLAPVAPVCSHSIRYESIERPAAAGVIGTAGQTAGGEWSSQRGSEEKKKKKKENDSVGTDLFKFLLSAHS
jgi:hypothetical protein